MLCGNALYCILQRCTGWCTAWYGGLLRSRVVRTGGANHHQDQYINKLFL